MLQKLIDESRLKVVVLDDDPTGTQTVHGISVYTDWSEESLRSGFLEDQRVFYILTNSRGMTETRAAEVNREIAKRTAMISKETGIPFLLVSRSDSTLRGHYPLETAVLRETLEEEGIRIDGEILCFFFEEGGRYTIDNIHYVRQGERLVPAAETEFAKDRTFGYTKSSLPEYIEEKTHGAFPASEVTCISGTSLRNKDYQKIIDQLSAVKDFGKVCVNAAEYADLKVFMIALYQSMAAGKRFLFRTAASFVKILGGISDRPFLKKNEMILENAEHGGLVVIGSHTQKTNEQLDELLKEDNVIPIAFDSDKVMDGDDVFAQEIERCVTEEEAAIRAGKTAVCYTGRKLLTKDNDTKESALLRSVKISEGVQNLVGRLNVRPSFVIAKGGITSSDVATKALGVRRALVLGQILPGIPVWQTGSESRFPRMPFIVFPGNYQSVFKRM